MESITSWLTVLIACGALGVSIWSNFIARGAKEANRQMSDEAQKRYLHEQLENDVEWKDAEWNVRGERMNTVNIGFRMSVGENIKDINVAVFRKGIDVSAQTTLEIVNDGFITVNVPKQWSNGIYDSEVDFRIGWTYVRSGLKGHQSLRPLF